MVRLVCTEMAGVDLPPGAMHGGPRRHSRTLEQVDDARMRRRQPARKLHGIALVVPALGRQRVLVVGRDLRSLLVDAALHAVGEDLRRVSEVPDDLEGRPLIELRRAKAIGRDGPHDAGDRRRVVRQPEGLVFVVPETFGHHFFSATMIANLEHLVSAVIRMEKLCELIDAGRLRQAHAAYGARGTSRPRPGRPTTVPRSKTTSPRERTTSGQPVTSHPSYGS